MFMPLISDLVLILLGKFWPKIPIQRTFKITKHF